MKKYRISFVVIFLSTTLACNLQVQLTQPPASLQITPSPPVSPTPFQVPSPTEHFITPTLHLDIPFLTLDGLKNAEYRVTVNGVEQTIRMTNGQYQLGADPTSPGFFAVTVGDLAAFGDLNSDTVDDAVVILSEWYGGTGINVFVAAVINWAGTSRHAASVLIDDRAIINSIRIENGFIIVDTVVHSDNDPGCCPSQQKTRIFRLVDQNLVEEK